MNSTFCSLQYISLNPTQGKIRKIVSIHIPMEVIHITNKCHLQQANLFNIIAARFCLDGDTLSTCV